MTLIVLVRHGQASWGAADYDVLSPHGHVQSTALGRAWREANFAPTRMVSGPMRRHVETAAAVRAELAAAPEPEVVPGFEEFDHVDVLAGSLAPDGSLPPLDESGMEDVFNDALRSWITADGTRTYKETYAQFRQRVRAAFGALRERLGSDDKSVVVTSGGVIAAIVCDLLGVDDERWAVLAAPIVNSSSHKILVRDGHPMLVSFNEHAHLATHDITYA